jgi:Flp pilus assembly protein CpaB
MLGLLRVRLRRARRHPAVFWTATALLALLTASSMSHALAAGRRFGPLRTAMVVRRPVPTGAVVSAADVRAARVPSRFVPDDAATDVVGRTAVAALLPGEVVQAGRLAPEGLHGVAALVPDGLRAVSVPTGDASAPVLVGDRVDVLATFDVADDAGDPVVPVARAALVVDVREGAVTVAVMPSEAPRVAFAVARGTVTVALVPVSGRGSASPGEAGVGAEG